MNESTIKQAGVNLSVFKDTQSVSDTDKAKVREYAKLIKVQENLHKEIEKVSKLLKFVDSRWCKDYIWINQSGDVIPIFDIDDEYLKNIYSWSMRNHNRVSKGVLKEYISRFGIPDELPDTDAKFKSKNRGKYGFVEEDDYDNDF